MTFSAKHLVRASAGCLLFVLGATPLFAQRVSYDRYGSLLREPPASATAKNVAAHFLVYPFELVRWPVDRSLVYIEKHHIDKKVRWIYDTIEDQGITPRANIISVGSLGGGVTVDFIRLLRQKENFPDALAQSWLNWTHNVIFEVGAKVGWERVGDTGFRTSGIANYESRPEEHFYGIGPDTSAGDGTSYKMEATTLEPSIGYRWDPTLVADFKFGYRNINITNGEDEGRGIIDKIFFPQTIPGLAGDELISLGAEIDHDTRNRKENSTTGGFQRFGFSYHEGLRDSEARYFKYEIEAAHFLRLGSERRVLALHFYGEHNDETDDHRVPFHQMAKLGGFGAYPRLSHPLRGFDFNRFFDESALLFNVEYRYTIWEYRDFKMDAVVFFDEGQVFGEFSEFKMEDFRASYGGGFRLSLAHQVIFAVELAGGEKGLHVYVKSSAPF